MYRPRKLDTPTKTYNVVMPVDMLATVKSHAEGLKISPAEFVRMAVGEALGISEGAIKALADVVPPEKNTSDTGYNDGVDDACAMVRKNVRLGVKLATGITIGEDIANRIKRDLGVTFGVSKIF